LVVIDLHCHLDLYKDPNRIASICIERGIYVLSVTTVPSAFHGTVALAQGGKRIMTALGLHPELAVSRAGELPLFERLLGRTRYVGEVGLDGSRPHRASLDRQKGILKEILQMCARAGGKVITLHSRGATSLLLDVLSVVPDAGTFILHWFLGSSRNVARALELNCWFSVGPAMLLSQSGVAALAAMPHDRIVPESDGPFTTIDGHVLYPWEAWTIVPQLAESWRLPVAQVERQFAASFKSATREVDP
jgi:TatD DNase family protein